MRRELMLPLIFLALVLAAIGGFAGAAWALTGDGGGNGESTQSAPATVPEEPTPEEGRYGLGPFESPEGPGKAGHVAYLGVVLAESPDDGDALVLRVARGSPAGRAGIEPEDVIVAVDGEAVDEPGDVVDVVRAAEPSDELTLTIRRGEDEREISVTLGRRPPGMEGLLPALPPDLPRLPNGKLHPGLRPFRGALLDRLFDGPERLLERFVSGEIAFLNAEGEVETVRAAAGTVESVDGDELVLAPKGGGPDERFEVSDETRVWRFPKRGELGDVEEGDHVVVVTRDGDEAVAVVILEERHPEDSSQE